MSNDKAKRLVEHKRFRSARKRVWRAVPIPCENKDLDHPAIIGCLWMMLIRDGRDASVSPLMTEDHVELWSDNSNMVFDRTGLLGECLAEAILFVWEHLDQVGDGT